MGEGGAGHRRAGWPRGRRRMVDRSRSLWGERGEGSRRDGGRQAGGSRDAGAGGRAQGNDGGGAARVAAPAGRGKVLPRRPRRVGGGEPGGKGAGRRERHVLERRAGRDRSGRGPHAADSVGGGGG